MADLPAETAFLAAVRTLLTGASLSPAPSVVGVSEPSAATDLPSLVLSLETVVRPGVGLGAGADVVEGHLPLLTTIDLAAPPHFPDEPATSMLNEIRTELVLPQGGLVRSDGSTPNGPLAAADVSVKLNGGALPIVTTAAPAAGEVRVDGGAGTLAFGTPLPAAGTLVVAYAIGQWERRIVRIEGALRLDACDGNADGAANLCDTALTALLGAVDGGTMTGLLGMALASVSSVGPKDAAAANARRRTARLSFRYDHIIDKPASSGGVIGTIDIRPRDPADGVTFLEKERFHVPL